MVRDALHRGGCSCAAVPPPAITPEMHVWVSAKRPWVRIDNRLPQHAEGSPIPYRQPAAGATQPADQASS
jgi:hypothetical protein